jgi:hypothetical protein
LTTSTFKGGYVDFFKDSLGQRYYTEFGQNADSSLLTLNFYEVSDNYELGNLVLTKEWVNRHAKQIGFINNELVIIYASPFLDGKLYIEIFDTSGEMLKSRLYDSSKKWAQVYASYLGSHFKEILAHPQLPKAFVLTSFVGVEIFVIDQNTLDTVITYNAEEYGGPGNANLINYGGYFQLNNRSVRMEYDGIMLIGEAFTKPYYLWDGDIWTNDDQFYCIKQKWDRSYEIQDFGPKDINNGICYGYGVNEATQTRVIAGSIPFDDFRLITDEKREILIYMYDQWGKYDSIFIHGDKNHIATGLLVEDNGDIFIGGTYSNAWSNDSVYKWVTKIPGIAVGMIEQEKINNHLYIYPNPTVETVQIKEVAKFLNAEFDIYSQTGVLVKQGKVTGESIDVSDFTAGVYVLTIRSESKEQFNAVFIKD